MEITKAFHQLVQSPPDSNDVTRQEAVDYLNGLGVRAYVSSIPQDYTNGLAITIEPQGGDEHRSTNEPQPCRTTEFEVHVWGRGTANRSIVGEALELGEQLSIALHAWSGTISEVGIAGVYADGPPIQRDQPPKDKSDAWTTELVYVYQVTHDVTRANGV